MISFLHSTCSSPFIRCIPPLMRSFLGRRVTSRTRAVVASWVEKVAAARPHESLAAMVEHSKREGSVTPRATRMVKLRQASLSPMASPPKTLKVARSRAKTVPQTTVTLESENASEFSLTPSTNQLSSWLSNFLGR